MRNPAEFALRRPRVVLLATLLFLLYGILSYTQLPRQENPDFQDYHVAITTYLPGAEPEKMELLVSKVIEDKVAEVDDLDMILNENGTGRSWFLIRVKKNAPLEKRLREIEDKVQQARAELPVGASEPEIDTDTIKTNTMVLTITGDTVSPVVLHDHAKALKRKLETLPDVRGVDMLGEPEEEIAVDVDLRALSQKRLSLPKVVSALAARNVLLPGGELEMGQVNSPIRTTGAYESADDVAATYLGAADNGLAITLADVAQVSRRVADPTVLVRTNGTPGISLAVEMLPGKNAIKLGERVRTLIADVAPSLPDGVAVHIVADEPTYVRERIGLLTSNLLAGMALVVALIILGMGWRSGLMVSLSIPLSLTIAMGGLSLAGVAFHQISIAALVIAIGIVVDEAIVVTDNIHRHLDRGSSPKEAAVKGLGEIHLAVLAGALTTVAAFLPLALMSGDIGDFIRSIPLSVTIMLLASIMVAHYFTPLFATWVHARSQARGVRTRVEAHRFEPTYRRVLDLVVRHNWLVLVGFVAVLVITVYGLMTYLWPPVFFPAADRRQFIIKVDMPTGAPVEETDALMRQVEARLAAEPKVHDYTAFVGAGAPKFYYNEFTEGRSESGGMFIVNTQPGSPLRETATLVERLDDEFRRNLAGAHVRVRQLKQGYGAGSDIAVYVTGDDLTVLRALNERIRHVMQGVPGVVDVQDEFGYDPVTLEARIDNAKANLLGISHMDIATTLRTAVDGIPATTFRDGDEELDVTVRLLEHQRRNVADLETLPVYSPDTGRAVPLSHLATLEPTWTTRSITRWQRKREGVVSADVEGRPVADVAPDIHRALKEQVPLPAGYEYTFEGEIKELWESIVSLAKAALVAIFLIYIILVIEFNSMAQPLLIVLAIPMALIGASWGLIVTGHALGFMAFVGFIALTGIVVNDSIVLMDYINTLRRRGLDLESAVSRGAATRLRPVVLTSVTTIGGLLPLSLTGGSFWQPFGYAMIFGLAASTLLTLLVQPAAYLTLERWRSRRKTMDAAPRMFMPTEDWATAGADSAEPVLQD